MWGRVCVEQYVTRSLQDSTRQHNAFWAIEISNLELVSNIPGTLSVFWNNLYPLALRRLPKKPACVLRLFLASQTKHLHFLDFGATICAWWCFIWTFLLSFFIQKKFNSSKIVVFVQKRRFVWEDSSKKIHRRKFIGEDLPETPVRCSIASNNCDLCE